MPEFGSMSKYFLSRSIFPVRLEFRDNSTAGTTTITNSGLIQFYDNSDGGQAQLINANSGAVDSHSLGPNGDGKVSVGSIEGSGSFFLGATELIVGGNNLSTNVSGVISDGSFCFNFPCFASGGSIVKVGNGNLALTGI